MSTLVLLPTRNGVAKFGEGVSQSQQRCLYAKNRSTKMSASESRNGRTSPQPGPFGYSFLSPMDAPYEPAPDPPLGPALLDDNESNMLENFFTTMNSNHFDTSDFWLHGSQSKSAGRTFNFGWSTGLPPTFEGSSTSLSQPNTRTESDLFAAASMLYQHGGQSFGTAYSQHPFTTHTFTSMNGNATSPSHHFKPVQAGSNHSESKEENSIFVRPRLPAGIHTSEMLFDLHRPVSNARQASAKPRTLHWGSDMSFMDQCYVAPPNQPNEEERTKELLDNLECLEPQTSANNTRAPSPVKLTSDQNSEWTGTRSTIPPHRDYSRVRRSLDEGTQPKKRLKLFLKEEDDDSDVETAARSRSRNSKPRRVSTDRPRSKSGSRNGPKQPRENLTEEQKRTNHILSEQKRRNLIRQGFEDLCSLVPGLRGGGFSKSAMLTQAADWLEEIIRGNEILKSQLAQLKSSNDLVIPR